MAEIDLIKISELPATSTIGDADELAVVQGGATKKVPYSALKAGAEVTPDTTLSVAGVPADAAAVGAALALKANQAAVTQALAAKADKTEVTDISGDIAELASVVETKADQTALNQKADKTTTDALRQDLTTLNGIVSQKADKTELNTQIGNVTAELATKANTADVNNLLAAKANVASPVFTGRPQAPTAPKGTATLQLATTAFVQNAIDDKQDALTFDAAPTQGSTNPVTSGGVYTALEDAKDDTETAIAEVREESEEATTEAREIALKAFATPTASGQLVTLTDGADGIPAKKVTLNLSPHQSGSGDPSPENVRPISGYESVTVTRAGKNVLPKSAARSQTTNGITFTAAEDGTVTASGTATANAIFTIASGFTLPSGSYHLSGCPAGGGDGVYRIDAISSAASGFDYGTGASLTLAETTTFNYARIIIWSGQTVSGLVFHPMLRPAEFTDGTYAPYQGEDYTITIPTAAGTVYGGSLTVNDDGTGTLTVDMAKVTIDGSSNVSLSSATNPNGKPWIYAIDATNATDVSNRAVSDKAVSTPSKSDSTIDVGEFRARLNGIGTRVFVCFLTDSTVTTLAELQAKLAENPYELAYPLADPQTYTLTASQVTTLLGDNTLWMDADGSIDLVYRADTEKYVERRIAEVQALVLENNG